jgi:hypothetical protein
VATIEQIISRLDAPGQKVTDAVQLLGAAEQAAGQLQAQMSAVGVQDKAVMFASVRESVQRTRQHLAGGQELISQSGSQAKAAGG